MRNKPAVVDAIDARILTALTGDPRASGIALADRTGLSRNTVQA
ncbi:MAG: AsnC family transcriptional regulator, partial [Mycobacterium sp.]